MYVSTRMALAKKTTRSNSMIPRDMTRGNGHKGKQKIPCLNISRIFIFTV